MRIFTGGTSTRELRFIHWNIRTQNEKPEGNRKNQLIKRSEASIASIN